MGVPVRRVQCRSESLAREENGEYSRWFTLAFNMTWVVFDIHVDGGSDHTAVLVRLWVIQVDSLGAGDATVYITRRRTCGRRWLYEAPGSSW